MKSTHFRRISLFLQKFLNNTQYIIQKWETGVLPWKFTVGTDSVYLHFPILSKCDFLLRTPISKTSQTSILHFWRIHSLFLRNFFNRKDFPLSRHDLTDHYTNYLFAKASVQFLLLYCWTWTQDQNSGAVYYATLKIRNLVIRFSRQ